MIKNRLLLLGILGVIIMHISAVALTHQYHLIMVIFWTIIGVMGLWFTVAGFAQWYAEGSSS